MSSYTGYHADLYDLFYGSKSYKHEANFTRSCILKYQPAETRTILELACGTGNHSIHLSKYKYKITATDYSRDMLRVASQKLSSLENVQVAHMDMLQFRRFKKPFDAVICLFDSIGYVQTNTNIAAVLKSIHKNLKRKGLFVFEYWNAGAMLHSYEAVRVKKWKVGERKIIRKSETTMRYHKQLCDVKYTVEEYQRSALKRKFTETQTNRFFLPQEMNYFLSEAGFVPMALYDGYSKKTVSETSWHVLCVAQKR